MTDVEQQIPATLGIAEPWRIAFAWLSRRSYLTVAAIVQLVAWALRTLVIDVIWFDAPNVHAALIGASLLLPGPLKRRDVRQALAALAFGSVALPVWGWILTGLHPDYWPLFDEVIWPLGLTSLVGIVEWLFRPGDSWSLLGWNVLSALAAAALLATATYLPFRDPSFGSVGWYLTQTMIALFSWGALTAASWIATQRRNRRILSVVAVGIMLGGYATFFHWGIYDLARRSIASGGPMNAGFAVQLLALRGRETDYDAIASHLDHADWSKTWSRYDYGPELGTADSRAIAVDAMMLHDEVWAAERLSRVLLAMPSRALLDMTDGLFVRLRRLETVPIIMRYALEESRPYEGIERVGEDRFKKALEELRVPQVIDAWLIDEAMDSLAARMLQSGERREFVVEDLESVKLTPKMRDRLSDLLKFDAGPSLLDWFAASQEMMASAPTPLTESLREETDRVVKHYHKYTEASNRWRKAHPAGEANGALKPADPNWDVPTTDGYCREIDDYVARVDAALSSTSIDAQP